MGAGQQLDARRARQREIGKIEARIGGRVGELDAVHENHEVIGLGSSNPNLGHGTQAASLADGQAR